MGRETEISSLKKVFRNPSSIAIASIGALAVFTFAVWLPNFSLIVNTVGNSNVPLGIKARLLWGLFKSITTNFSLFSASYTILIAILFGVNLAMTLYLLKKDKALRRGGVATSVSGTVSGMFGIGCAACGSYLAGSALSLVGASGALALLPLRGGEFGILGVVLLATSIFFATRKITVPATCPPKLRSKA
ncbi:hypothetical protein C4571_03280 [Candidatus Parcubacteria bacterium]|nr:MAG: hypothetical protein C4571_03280 [Candidatus Parcubacteria bacterium]